MKPIKAWAIVNKEHRVATTSDWRLLIYDDEVSAESWSDVRGGEKVVRVEIREVKK